jgi:hypothetical protein
MKVQLATTIDKLATRVDNTIAITVSTQELSPEESAALFSLKGKLGWMMFAENSFNEDDVPKEQAPDFKGGKTPSQRLRAVLFKYWELNTNRSKVFDVFYHEWMNKKIDEIKETLN